MNGRGGHWNRAGRRSGGYRPVPLIVGAAATAPRCACAVPECDREAKNRVPIEERVEGAFPLDGRWWLPLCDAHYEQLRSIRPESDP